MNENPNMSKGIVTFTKPIFGNRKFLLTVGIVKGVFSTQGPPFDP